MRKRRPHLTHTLLLGTIAMAVPGIPALLATSTAPTASAAPLDREDLVVPEDVERIVVGDMVVDWIGGAPEGAVEALTTSDVPAELTVPDAADEAAPAGRHDHGAQQPTELHAAAELEGEVSEDHAAASGGYALFSTTARWLPTGYTIRLTGDDPRIEQYRDELTEAARAASAMAGVPIHVAPALGGAVNPARGEIAAVLGTGPCGPDAVGCGGPGLTASELVSGRVWIHPSALGISPAQRANLGAHELGHALGLQHFDGSWTDGRQVMYPTITGTTSYRAGDGAGLRRLAGADDRPAGAVASRTYAAGWAHVSGTVTSGSKVRIFAGSVATDVPVKGGRFTGAIPLPAGKHVICATSLDAAAGFRRELGCGEMKAPGKPFARGDGVRASFETIRLSGWALDPQTAEPVQLQVRRNGALVTTLRADQPRDDLGDRAAHYGTAHGFAADIPAVPGLNRICVRILGVGGGGDRDAGCADVVHAVDPVGSLEAIRAEGLGASVTGWALDPNSPDPVSIEVRVDGRVPAVGGSARASEERPDVAAQHPAHGADHGFSHHVALKPGRHEVCVSIVNVGLGRNVSLGCADVVVEEVTAARAPAIRAGVDHAVDSVLDTVAAPTTLVEDLTTVLGR